MSVPSGAFEAVQLPDPEASDAVHRTVPPVLKATVPVGVPVPVVGDTWPSRSRSHPGSPTSG